MRRRDFLMAAGVAPAAMLAGCGGKKPGAARQPEPEPGKPEPTVAKPVAKPAPAKQPGTVVLCYKCGQIKGSAKCCKAGAPKCSRCGLHAGSPGCCRIA
ncbi:MAG: hypothetical protein ACYTFI_23665, partial [Planctomycetota bacterium]